MTTSQPSSFVVKEGWLIKQGGKYKTWKKRWFVLKNNHIAYYKEPGKDAVGRITFSIVSSVAPAADWNKKEAKKFYFRVNVNDGRPGGAFLIGAEDEDTAKEWMNKIEETLEKYRKTGVGLNALSFDKLKENAQEKQSEESTGPISPVEDKTLKALQLDSKNNRRHSAMTTATAKPKKKKNLNSTTRLSMAPHLLPGFADKRNESFSEEDCSDEETPDFKFDDEVENSVADTIKSKELYRAVVSGNAGAIKAWLQLGTNVNWKNVEESNRTALHAAVQAGENKIMMDLISHNADIHVQDNNGTTPLHLAASEGHIECLEALLKIKGINVFQTDGHQRSAIYCSIFTGRLECSKILLNYIIDHADTVLKNEYLPVDKWKIIQYALENRVDDLRKQEKLILTYPYVNQLSPYHAACSGGSLESLKYLLSIFKSDKTSVIIDQFQRSLLHYAAARGSTDIIKHLLSIKVDINARDCQNKTPIHFAAGLGRYEAVDLLLGNNCLVGKDENEFTPLHSACIYGREKTVEILLKHAVDINGKGKNGITPLYLACHNGDVETVQLLLSNRANVNERTDDNRTPLHEACHRGNVACLKTLLESNANIEAVDLQGNTGLMIAILSNSVGCVSLLIENKADVFIKNNIGETSLSLAVQAEDTEIVYKLLEQGLDCNQVVRGVTPLFTAASKGNKAIVKIFIDNGVTIDFEDRWKTTPLLRAVSEGHHDIVSILLEAGANVNHQTVTGVSPLQEAAVLNRIDCLELLLSYGAQVDIKNDQGSTPLHEAAAFGCNDAVTRLIIFGASLDALDNNSLTPLDRAALNGKITSVLLLLAYSPNYISHSSIANSLNSIMDTVISLKDERLKNQNQSGSSQDNSTKESKKHKIDNLLSQPVSTEKSTLKQSKTKSSSASSSKKGKKEKEKESPKPQDCGPLPQIPIPASNQPSNLPAILSPTGSSDKTGEAFEILRNLPKPPVKKGLRSTGPIALNKSDMSNNTSCDKLPIPVPLSKSIDPTALPPPPAPIAPAAVSPLVVTAAIPPPLNVPSGLSIPPPIATVAAPTEPAVTTSIVAPVAAPAPVLSEQEMARLYIKKAQQALTKDDYKKFHRLLLEYKEQKLKIVDLFNEIHALFLSHRSITLLEEFITFVPPQYKEQFIQFIVTVKNQYE